MKRWLRRIRGALGMGLTWGGDALTPPSAGVLAASVGLSIGRSRPTMCPSTPRGVAAGQSSSGPPSAWRSWSTVAQHSISTFAPSARPSAPIALRAGLWSGK